MSFNLKRNMNTISNERKKLLKIKRMLKQENNLDPSNLFGI